MTVLECTPSLREEIVTVLRKARLPASFKSMFASSALNRAECLTVELQALAQKTWSLSGVTRHRLVRSTITKERFRYR